MPAIGGHRLFVRPADATCDPMLNVRQTIESTRTSHFVAALIQSLRTGEP